MVYSNACHYAPSRVEADEVFLTVFEILLESLPRLRQEHALAEWLSAVAQHFCGHPLGDKPLIPTAKDQSFIKPYIVAVLLLP